MGLIHSLLRESLVLSNEHNETYNSFEDVMRLYDMETWVKELLDGYVYGEDINHYIDIFLEDELSTSEDEFVEQYGNGDMNSVDWMQSPEFMDYMQDNYELMIGEIEEPYVYNGYATIYRKMQVSTKWLQYVSKPQNKKLHLGIYWSSIEEAAEIQRQGTGEHDVLLTGKVSVEGVDWFASLQLNLTYGTGPDEKEIRLFNNIPIYITDMTIDDVSWSEYYTEQQCDQIKNNTYYA